jgi:hypothetical protein
MTLKELLRAYRHIWPKTIFENSNLGETKIVDLVFSSLFFWQLWKQKLTKSFSDQIVFAAALESSFWNAAAARKEFDMASCQINIVENFHDLSSFCWAIKCVTWKADINHATINLFSFRVIELLYRGIETSHKVFPDCYQFPLSF